MPMCTWVALKVKLEFVFPYFVILVVTDSYLLTFFIIHSQLCMLIHVGLCHVLLHLPIFSTVVTKNL
jgi:hypothetical protein